MLSFLCYTLNINTGLLILRRDYNMNVYVLIKTEMDEEFNFHTTVCGVYTKEGKVTNKYPCFEYDLFFAPVKKSGWINLYKINSIISPGPRAYDTEEEAESAAVDKSNYISTIKIEWEE